MKFLAEHWAWLGPVLGAGGYHILGAAISTIPPLPENAGFWKTWFYRIFQVLGANYDKVGQTEKK
jgi:hypothetical protein